MALNLNIQASDPVLKGETYHPNKFGSINGFNMAKLITVTILALGILGILATVGFTTYDGIYLHMLPASNWIPMGISAGLILTGGLSGWYCAKRTEQQEEKLKKAVEDLPPKQKNRLLRKQAGLNSEKYERRSVYESLKIINPETRVELHVLITKKSIHYFSSSEALENFASSMK